MSTAELRLEASGGKQGGPVYVHRKRSAHGGLLVGKKRPQGSVSVGRSAHRNLWTWEESRIGVCVRGKKRAHGSVELVETNFSFAYQKNSLAVLEFWVELISLAIHLHPSKFMVAR